MAGNSGEAPFTLLDYFPDDFLMVIDESHVTIPQINGQFAGDKSRKDVLIEHGFRLPSALDNRPLRFDEWYERTNQTVLLSATPRGLGAARILTGCSTDNPTDGARRPRGDCSADEGTDRRSRR